MAGRADPAPAGAFLFPAPGPSGRGGQRRVLAMVTANLPTLLINFWFSPLVAGYFAVVNRFCLAPVIIVGNAIRHAIFSRWSEDFRQHRFNGQEFRKVKLLLLAMGSAATLGILICYPLVMRWCFNEEWIASIDTSVTCCPMCSPPWRSAR